MLNEPNALIFTDTEITDWINRGTNIVMKDSKCKRNIITKLLTNGTAEYSYATLFTATPNAITVEAVFYAGGTTATVPAPQVVSGGYCLEKIHPRQITTSPHAAGSAPRFWYDRNDTIGISPTPTTAGGLAGYVFLYYENENLFVPNTTINALPNHLQEVVTWYVLAQANIKTKRYSVANMFMSIFMNYLMFYRQDYFAKPVDSADMMTAPDYTQFA
jgi:hypothetical protein